ncbi:glycosyltransferase family 2 protein [Streptomyces sp. TRM66268-LWL]|uniref:Glycosyltransferase family 2 protein n=1 Tax=Streptomyces polyasparticus TaxID=2767826 RepID=A0ABR7SW11_9ACTN|nr:glycosyltransferase family 2 protein [Streptomyces polyasparticus]MBC9719675.1 glycosyltransferase family 2 protein [Streptomyces polyasparticus]
MLLLLFNTVVALVTGFGLVYFLAATIPGVRFSRKEQASPLPPPPSASERQQTYFLIPCLNEASVIGNTIHSLRAEVPQARIVVVDDGSDDGTVAAALDAGGSDVRVVARALPDARQGKGAALNAGFRWILQDAAARELDPANTLICVMDADGRLSEDGFSHVVDIFRNPAVGGVQLPVCIRNRDRFITLIQDLEFWGLSATSQFGRNYSRTVSLGGNGQFTRLSALIGLGRQPWSNSLTEDLDLALSLGEQGWELATTSRAYVDQEGVDSWRRLIIQRTRWFQGHMQAIRHLPAIWKSRKVSNIAALEMTLYLLVPWVLTLPWSVVFHIALGMLGVQLITGTNTGFMVSTETVPLFLITSVAFYLISFFPMLFSGWLYHRRDRSYGLVRCLLLGHALLVSNYVAYTAAWRALARILRGQNNWVKTDRSGEHEGIEAGYGGTESIPGPTVRPALNPGVPSHTGDQR